MVHCTILGCIGRSERHEDKITFHTFPQVGSVLRQSWILATGRENWTPSKYSRVCSRHFEEKCFKKTSRKTYLVPCVPSLYVHFTQMPLTPAEKQRRFRKNLKTKDPAKYEEYRRKSPENAKQYYRKKESKYTEEEKEKNRQQWRDVKGNTSPTKRQKKKPLTPAEKQKRYRENLKMKYPDKYEEYRKRNAENAKQHYRKKVSKYTERAKITAANKQKRYRERIKMENPRKHEELKKKNAERTRRYYREKADQAKSDKEERQECNARKCSSAEKQENKHKIVKNVDNAECTLTHLQNEVNKKGRKKLTSAEEQKSYREKLRRENPEKYLEIKRKLADRARQYYRKKSSKQDAQPGPSETPIWAPSHSDSSGVLDATEDPLSNLTDQCRFCGQFSKDCFVVSSNMPYLAGDTTTLTLNNTSVNLDFNDDLPKTVCKECDSKLKEICDFVKLVKDAQELINVKTELEENDTREVEVFIKTEDNESNDSLSIGDTVFIKKTVTRKRKTDTDHKKPKVTKIRGCDMVECEDFVVDIKDEIESDDDSIESSRCSDVDSETLSIPEELKHYLDCGITDETFSVIGVSKQNTDKSDSESERRQ